MYGEGILDCLKREWEEELDVRIKPIGHFYTTESFSWHPVDENLVAKITFPIDREVTRRLVEN